ncbi:MAG: putative lipoprotein [Rickettsiaceae bacterium]|jgi:uncharacterized lipoprotein YajG|nr:putative lipoprotein [Rickettsiaceae bacterium]
MKKFAFSIILLGLLSSCVYYDKEQVNLDLSINKRYADFSGSKVIEVAVVDERMDKKIIGTKRLGEELVPITANKNLIDVIKDKVTKDLEQDGFFVQNPATSLGGKITDLTNKSLEIKIVNFRYTANRGFLEGSSKIEILLRVTAKGPLGKKYVTDKNFYATKKHFIVPLISTDEKIINESLQEALDSLLQNPKLTEFLRS